MLDKTKPYFLVGLTLAVAGGLVLAHFAIRMADYLYLENPSLLASIALASVTLCLIVWQRVRVFGWVRIHKRGFAFTVLAILVAYSAAVVIAISRH